jgi:putative solute:sodium symporter small subunit
MSQENEPPKDAARYWTANLRLLLLLLAVWFLASLGLSILLVEPLNAFRIGGFPLGFWFAQQGSIYVFVLLILVYALLMDRIDEQHDVD